MKLCKPKITVISTSKSDLPPSGYVSYIRRQGSKVYVTAGNRHGDVTIASDGKELTVTTEN